MWNSESENEVLQTNGLVFQMTDTHFSKKHQDVEHKATEFQQTPHSPLRQIFRNTKYTLTFKKWCFGEKRWRKQRRICSTSQGHILMPTARDHLDLGNGWGWQLCPPPDAGYPGVPGGCCPHTCNLCMLGTCMIFPSNKGFKRVAKGLLKQFS